MKQLTTKEKLSVGETLEHIQKVQGYIFTMVKELLNRARDHDKSKMTTPEVEAFAEVTGKLHGLTYGSPEYHANLKTIEPALKHHYGNNRHHPQHFPNGVNDMNLIDLIELVADWKSSAERQNDGNVRFGLATSSERFSIGPQLMQIIENTITCLE
jgi:hypothetical protein